MTCTNIFNQNKGSNSQHSHFDDRQTDKQDNGTSNFFEDSSDDDHIDLPDITDGNNDLDLEKLNEEFGMTGWAEKKKKGRGVRDIGGHRRSRPKASGTPTKAGRARGEKVSRQRHENVDSSSNAKATSTAGGKCQEDQEEETLPVLQRGDTVDAKVEGWIRYYSGEVENLNRDGSIDVRFHDGDLEKHIPRVHVKLIRRRKRTTNRKTERQRDKGRVDSGNRTSRDVVENEDETIIDENKLVQRSAATRSNSNSTDMTEPSSPRQKEGKRLPSKKANSKITRGNSSSQDSELPKGSSTEPKGVKREAMTPYDDSLVPSRRTDLAKFLILPAYKGWNKRIRCYIKRHKNSFNMFNPYYTFHLERRKKKKGEVDRQLMVAQELMGTSSCNFLISLDREDMGKYNKNKRGKFYLGKLQAKKGTDEFVLYDSGLNPEDLIEYAKCTSMKIDDSNARREMASIIYDRSKSAAKSRRMEVALPAVIKDDGRTVTEAQYRPFTDEDSMYTKFKKIRQNETQNVELNERLLCLHNRVCSIGRGARLRDYEGRATETSVKNFQLCVSHPGRSDKHEEFMASKLGRAEKDEPERVILQLGRTADVFNVDFTYPMSFFAAFAICLTRFVTKYKDDF